MEQLFYQLGGEEFNRTIDVRRLITDKKKGVAYFTEKIAPEFSYYPMLISKGAIHYRIQALARQIVSDDVSQDFHLIYLLNGAKPFAEALSSEIRQLERTVFLESMHVRSYSGTKSSGQVELLADCGDIAGKNVYLLDDVLDTGLTLSWTENHLLSMKNAASVKICCLLDKPDNRSRKFSDFKIGYTGFIIPNLYVFGFGLDMGGQHREKEAIYYKG